MLSNHRLTVATMTGTWRLTL